MGPYPQATWPVWKVLPPNFLACAAAASVSLGPSPTLLVKLGVQPWSSSEFWACSLWTACWRVDIWAIDLDPSSDMELLRNLGQGEDLWLISLLQAVHALEVSQALRGVQGPRARSETMKENLANMLATATACQLNATLGKHL